MRRQPLRCVCVGLACVAVLALWVWVRCSGWRWEDADGERFARLYLTRDLELREGSVLHIIAIETQRRLKAKH